MTPHPTPEPPHGKRQVDPSYVTANWPLKLYYRTKGNTPWCPWIWDYVPRPRHLEEMEFAIPEPPSLQPEKGKGGELAATPIKLVRESQEARDAIDLAVRCANLTPPAPTAADEELRVRVRIAEWMGWTVKFIPKSDQGPECWDVIKPDGKPFGNLYARKCDAIDKLPDFCASLDAIASAEAKLTEEQQIRYMMHLTETTKLGRYPVGFGEVFVLTHATALQRCRALLHTIEEKEQRE